MIDETLEVAYVNSAYVQLTGCTVDSLLKIHRRICRFWRL
jgi:hypothetical protein